MNTYYLITWVFEELIVLQLNVVLVAKIAFFSGLYQLSVSVNVCVCVCALFMCTTVLCPSFFLCRGRLKIVLPTCRATAQSSPTPYCLTNQQVCHPRPEWLHENRCVCVMCGGASMYMHAFALDIHHILNCVVCCTRAFCNAQAVSSAVTATTFRCSSLFLACS